MNREAMALPTMLARSYSLADPENLMSHTACNLLVHIVFSTKDRQPLIDAEIRPKLYAYMGGILRRIEAISLGINGIADHVHALEYIAKQEEHHRTMSFQEEYLAFLERHGVAYDPEYIWA